ncbi:MAG: hypothetical protein ABR598_07240 [Candidatus Dormibacteria bacterium]
MTRLDEAVGELCELPLGQFIARRHELAREARLAQDRDAADAIAALRKPTVTVWLANRLARDHRLAVSRLLGTARDLASAQERVLSGADGAGDRLRRDSSEFQRALDRAVKEAGPLLADAGHAAVEETLRRLREVLSNAARGSLDVQERLARGDLLEEPPVPDFGVFGTVTPMPRRRENKTDTRAPVASAGRRTDDGELEAKRRGRLVAARREADRADDLLKRAEQAARRLRRRADAVAAEAAAAAGEADQAESAVDAARGAAESARRRLKEIS